MGNQSSKLIDRSARDKALAILDQILCAGKLDSDMLKHWPESRDKSVAAIGRALHRMVKSLKRDYHRNISAELPFHMLRKLQAAQAVLLSDCTANIREARVLRFFKIFTLTVTIVFAVAIVLWGESVATYFLLLGGMIFFGEIESFLGKRVEKIITANNKTGYWPFGTLDDYLWAMDTYKEKLSNPEYIQNHPLRPIYDNLFEKNPASPLKMGKMQLLMMLYGVPDNHDFLSDTDEDYLCELSEVLSKVLEISGEGPDSKFWPMLHRAEFFLTTDKKFFDQKCPYSPYPALVPTFTTIVGLILAVYVLPPLIGRFVNASWVGFFVVLAALVGPIVYFIYKQGKQNTAIAISTDYWPFASQEDFDAAKMEYPHTVYLLKQREK